MATWNDLQAELDRWSAEGREATIWWRDDDACLPHPNLGRLLNTAARADAPIHMATIPAWLTQEVVDLFQATPHVRVVQHGFAHMNHAAKGQGAWELGTHRPIDAVLAEMRLGLDKLAGVFGSQFIPVMAPPWTRIAPEVTARLAEVGFKGLSLVATRKAKYAAPGLLEVNARCEPIKWKGGARFTGTERALDDVVSHLRDRRTAAEDPEEPTGLLTHHIDHDEHIWGFVDELTVALNAHPATRWVTFDELFEEN